MLYEYTVSGVATVGQLLTWIIGLALLLAIVWGLVALFCAQRDLARYDRDEMLRHSM